MVGLPHSEILGSKLIRSSPGLIAAYYVLHRLHAPRHPLDALKTLDRSHYRCPLPNSTPLEKARLSSDLNDASRREAGWLVLIGQIKKEPEFTCICCLSPWVGIKQAAMHLFTMSKDPVTDAQKASRSPNLLSDLRRIISVFLGGAGRNRTDDILLAKQTLSQLSYGPFQKTGLPSRSWQRRLVGPGRLELPTSRLSGVRSNHLSYGPPSQVSGDPELG